MGTDGKELAMAERREFIEKMTEYVKGGILNRDDRKDIYRVCLAACERELANSRREE